EAAIWVMVKTRIRRRLPVTRLMLLMSPSPLEVSGEGRRGTNARKTAAASDRANPIQSTLKSTVRSAALTEYCSAYFDSTPTIGRATSIPGKPPLRHRTRPSASSDRRKAAELAPSAAWTDKSDSRRTARARKRFATLEQAITNSRPEAPNNKYRMIVASWLIWSRSSLASIWKRYSGL